MDNLNLNTFFALAQAKSLKILISPYLFCMAHFKGSVLSRAKWEGSYADPGDESGPSLSEIPAILDLALSMILSL